MTVIDYNAVMAKEALFDDLYKYKKAKWMGQTVLLHTYLFGREYFWMQDGDGTIYLAHVGEDGLPDLS